MATRMELFHKYMQQRTVVKAMRFGDWERAEVEREKKRAAKKKHKVFAPVVAPN